MKRWIAVIFILIVFLSAFTYLLIPGELKGSAVAYIRANPKAVSRQVGSKADWRKWWPEADAFIYKGKEYNITRPMYNALEVSVGRGEKKITTVLSVIPVSIDSTALEWKFELKTGSFPTQRIQQYRKAAQLKQELNSILSAVQKYYEDEKNLYGFTVKQTKVTDSVLIYTSKIFDHYPDAADVNLVVEKLRTYIVQNGAREQNHPMLNVMDLGNGYEAKVAIAVDRMLPETKAFSPKMVLKGGAILETEIRGGPHTIRQAFEKFEQYKTDHERVNPAMPYQLMVTDRVKEADTSKWITRLYYPVF